MKIEFPGCTFKDPKNGHMPINNPVGLHKAEEKFSWNLVYPDGSTWLVEITRAPDTSVWSVSSEKQKMELEPHPLAEYIVVVLTLPETSYDGSEWPTLELRSTNPLIEVGNPPTEESLGD